MRKLISRFLYWLAEWINRPAEDEKYYPRPLEGGWANAELRRGERPGAWSAETAEDDTEHDNE